MVGLRLCEVLIRDKCLLTAGNIYLFVFSSNKLFFISPNTAYVLDILLLNMDFVDREKMSKQIQKDFRLWMEV